MVKKIVMIDDDADDREIFQTMINTIDEEIEVTFGENGRDAFSILLRPDKPDVIFLDSRMPGMDGIECLRKLKGNGSTQHIPVIFYTALADDENDQMASRLGALNVLRKSSDIKSLTSQLQQMLMLVK
jgi:putative two-component system response regulator